MTSKRFTIESTTVNECIVDNTTGEQLDTFEYTERLCEVLNEQHEEIVELREAMKRLMIDLMSGGMR